MIRQLRVRAVTGALFGSIACVSACDSATRSTPIPVPPTAPSPPPRAPVPDPARATLEVFNFNVTEVGPRSGQGGYGYYVKFWLKETSGMSGATVLRIASTVNGAANDITGDGCWRERIRVEPGGTLDVFDSGWDALSYCAPYASSARKRRANDINETNHSSAPFRASR